MTARSYATKWPAAFNPDDPTVLSIAAVVDEHVDVSADSPQLPLHTHPTGQLALSVGGLVGLQLESGYCSLRPAGSTEGARKLQGAFSRSRRSRR